MTRADPQIAIEHLQVPEEDLAGMSTEALVKTVLGFPYAGNLLAFNTAQQAVQTVGEQCNALGELLGRADMAEQVEAVLGQVQSGEFTVDDVSSEMLVMYLEVLANPESSAPLPDVLG